MWKEEKQKFYIVSLRLFWANETLAQKTKEDGLFWPKVIVTHDGQAW